METRLIFTSACEAGSVGRDQLSNAGKIYSADNSPQHQYPDDFDAVDFRGTHLNSTVLNGANFHQIQARAPESSDDRTALPSTPYRDPELLIEERLGKVMAENENHRREKEELQKELRDLHDRLIRLQENNVCHG